MESRVVWAFFIAAIVSLIAVACGGDGDDPIRLYTSVTEATVSQVVEAFEADTGLEVEVFRAPTGELAARIAAEQREGGLQADILWLTDPLTMEQYAADSVLRTWEPVGAGGIDPAYTTETSWGTRVLSMVIVQRDDSDPLRSWLDLTNPDLRGRIAAPDPGFAGSAFAVLGFFAADPAYGLGFYQELRDNGLTVVNAPGEVVTGVAEGRFDAGITLLFSARTAVEKGSPIAIVWPEPGAISLYSPIAMVEGASSMAEQFVEFVLTPSAQELIAGTGWQPILDTVPWDVGGPQVSVNWADLADQRETLLESYQAIIDG
jgi:iron(III) transport system substrate-binding protein